VYVVAILAQRLYAAFAFQPGYLVQQELLLVASHVESVNVEGQARSVRRHVYADGVRIPGLA
jgi:hypothetical protein